MKETKFYFEDQLISIPIEFFNRSRRITEDTPQVEFLKGIHKTDVEREIAAIKYICQYLNHLEIKSVTDLMAGCGFSGKIFQKYLGAKLVLNDMSPACYEILKRNYPEERVLDEDAFLIQNKYLGEMTFIDFNNFTINKLDFWKKLFKKIGKQSKYLMITDSAVYGFKFGNLERYGCQTYEDYYMKLHNQMKKVGWFLSDVLQFGPATLVVFQRKKGTFRFHPDSLNRINIRNRKGLSIV